MKAMTDEVNTKHKMVCIEQEKQRSVAGRSHSRSPSRSLLYHRIVNIWTVLSIVLFLHSVVGMQQFIEQSDIVSTSYASSSSIASHNKCEPITISICKNIPYNTTIMPNLFGHSRQEEAGYEVHSFAPLVKAGCSPDLQFFLCSLYIPLCTILDHPIPPCRSLCESARACEKLMKTYRISWPDNLECSNFPEDGSGELCVPANNTEGAGTSAVTKTKFHPTKIIDSDTKRPTNHQHPNETIRNGAIGSSHSVAARNFRFVCPLQLKTPADMGYALKVNGIVSICSFSFIFSARCRLSKLER